MIVKMVDKKAAKASKACNIFEVKRSPRTTETDFRNETSTTEYEALQTTLHIL